MVYTVRLQLETMIKSAVQMKFVCLLLLSLAPFSEARVGPFGKPAEKVLDGLLARRFLFLVDSPTTTLDYHNGPVLTGTNNVIPVYVIWYGSFNETDKSAIRDFLRSFQGENEVVTDVMRWWNVTGGFMDTSGGSVASSVSLAGETDDISCSMGKSLKNADVETLVLNSLSTFPTTTEGIYFVLTSSDVTIQDFCMNSCSSHSATSTTTTSGGMQLPYAWVGNPKDQCPGMCAWPFAQPSYMPTSDISLPLPPNGDIGTDGMIIQMAYMLVGTASNPLGNAYYQGDASIPLEAGTACTGFGYGAYSGYPGELKKNTITGGEYNANGVNDREFLLPTIWDPATKACTPLSLSP